MTSILKLEEIANCNMCHRPVVDHDIDAETGIAYCYGCHHYFSLNVKSKKHREEIVIPQGTDFIRLRILRDEIDIRIKWSRNYKFWKSLFNQSDGFPAFLGVLAFLINKTTIEVREGYIKIDHSPIDILPMVFYSASIIKQFEVRPIMDGGLFSIVSNSDYGLYAHFTSGKEELLIWDLKKSTLLFIEQEIERVLKIVDRG